MSSEYKEECMEPRDHKSATTDSTTHHHNQEDIAATSLTRHYGITCDGCLQRDILGIRYACLAQCNYDLCAECYTKPHPIHREHTADHTEFDMMNGDESHQRRAEREFMDLIKDELELAESAVIVLIRFSEKLTEVLLDWANDSTKFLQSSTLIEPLLPQLTDSSLNRFLLPQLHPHPLQLYISCHTNGAYRCGACHHKGSELVYSCLECDFHLHPSCFIAAGGIDLNPQPIINRERTHTAATDLAERIEFFIPSIRSLIPELSTNAERNRLMAINSELKLRLSDDLLSGWIERYQLRRCDTPQARIELTRIERIALRGILQSILQQLLKMASVDSLFLIDDFIHPYTLYNAIYKCDDFKEFIPLCTYLNSPFTVEPAHPPETISSASWSSSFASNSGVRIPPPHPFPRVTPFETMLDDTFMPNAFRLKQLNYREWYFNPMKIKKYARDYAQLCLPSGDSYFSRYGITPLCFYGQIKSGLCRSPFELHRNHHITDDRCFSFRLNPSSSWRGRPVTVLVEIIYLRSFLTRSLETQVTFMDVDSGSIILQSRKDLTRSSPSRVSFPPPSIIQSLSASSSSSSHPSVAFQSSTTIKTEFERPTKFLRRENGEKEETGGQPSSSHTSSRSVPPLELCIKDGTTSHWMSTLRDCINQANYLMNEQSHADERPIQLPLNAQLYLAVQLCLFEDYPTHIWQANHPLPVRHYFTQELMREQSHAVGLPDLPSDLYHLIGEYEPALLPSPLEESSSHGHQGRCDFVERDISARMGDQDDDA